MSAQDNTRENKQKEIFGFGDHSRGEKHDFVSDGIKGELKTKKTGKSCSTKRRFTLETIVLWRETEFITSEYKEDDPKELTGNHFYFPVGALDDWLETQKTKLFEGTDKRLGYNDVEFLKRCLDPKLSKQEEARAHKILNLCEKNVHLNCPTIAHGYFKKHSISLKEESFDKQKNYLKETKKIG